jgi:hypothetical protein
MYRAAGYGGGAGVGVGSIYLFLLSGGLWSREALESTPAEFASKGVLGDSLIGTARTIATTIVSHAVCLVPPPAVEYGKQLTDGLPQVPTVALRDRIAEVKLAPRSRERGCIGRRLLIP